MHTSSYFDIDRLNRLYGDLSFSELEKMAKGSSRITYKARRHLIRILFFLRYSTRYMEDERFLNKPFDAYLKANFMMSETEFNIEFKALNWYPQTCKAIGIGNVVRIIKRTNANVAMKIFDGLHEIPVHERMNHFQARVEKYTCKAHKAQKTAGSRLRIDEVKELHAIIRQLEKELADCKKKSAQKDAHIRFMKDQINSRNESIQMKNDMIRDLEQTLHDYAAMVDELTRPDRPKSNTP